MPLAPSPLSSRLPALALGVTLALAPVFTALPTAEAADRGVIVRTNSQGFKICRDLKQDGSAYWRASASGILEDGGGDRTGSGRSFSISTCFVSQTECQRWVDRIHHLVAGIDELRHAGCSARGR